MAARLRDGIADGEWPVGCRLPATRDLARSLAVGLNTVRRALDELSAEGLVRAQQGSGFHVLAAPERTRTALTVGLLIANHEYFAQAVDGVERATRQAGARLLLACSDNDRDRELEQFRELLASGVDGLILAPAHPFGRDEEMSPLMEPPVPAVFIERTPRMWRRTHVSYVTSDLAGGVHTAVTHLIEHGRSRIGYYGSTRPGPSGEAYSGYAQALAEAGLEILDGAVGEPVAVSDADYTAACQRLRLDAVFFLREAHAIPMLARFRRAGIAVPDDIAVMEFCHHSAEAVAVPLSGLNLPRGEIGRTAAQLLLRNIELGDHAHTCDVHFQPTMTLRQSCGEHQFDRVATPLAAHHA